MHRASDLFMEYEPADFRSPEEMETGRPLRFPDPSPSSLEGFSVSAAESGEGRYHSLFCGSLWLDPPVCAAGSSAPSHVFWCSTGGGWACRDGGPIWCAAWAARMPPPTPWVPGP